MSSPIVSIRKKGLRKFLINFHQKNSHNNRISILTKLIGESIINQFPKKESINCLDVGCGDMVIAEKINEEFKNTHWRCIDIHPLPDSLKSTKKWQKYHQFDGKHIPFEDKKFEIINICDVLHHAGENTGKLLAEAARTGKFIIIKDHFEAGFYSRKMLQLMDFAGNWAYGINIPKRYFTRKHFAELCEEVGLELIYMNNNIQLYEHLPLIRNILSPKWQFIAVLKSQTA